MSIDWNKRTPKPRVLCTLCGRTETDGDHLTTYHGVPLSVEGEVPRSATHTFEPCLEEELTARRQGYSSKLSAGGDLTVNAKGDIELVTDDPLVKVLLGVAEEAGYTEEDIYRHLKLPK